VQIRCCCSTDLRIILQLKSFLAESLLCYMTKVKMVLRNKRNFSVKQWLLIHWWFNLVLERQVCAKSKTNFHFHPRLYDTILSYSHLASKFHIVYHYLDISQFCVLMCWEWIMIMITTVHVSWSKMSSMTSDFYLTSHSQIYPLRKVLIPLLHDIEPLLVFLSKTMMNICYICVCTVMLFLKC